LVQKKPSLPK
jgi:hypothetical protein